MEIIKLKSRVRTGTGKSYTRKARAQGWVPASFYGKIPAAVNIEVDYREFAALDRQKKLTHLIDLGLDGQTESVAVIKEIQRHVIKDQFIYHVDFLKVAMNEPVTVEVPVEIVGIPVGVKDGGGVLDHPIKKVTVECFPMDIPEKVAIDVTNLNVGESIHVRDVSIPKLTLKDSPEEVLAVVAHGAREEVKTEAAEAAPAAAPAKSAKAAAKPAPAAKPAAKK